MTRSQSPCGPEQPGETPDVLALEAATTLLELTRRILTQGSEPDYPQLAQWILQRGHLIEQMAVFPVDQLSSGVKPQVLELLMAAQSLDEAVMQNLEKCYAHLGDQLKGAKDAQALIDKYRVPSAPPGTRSREA